MARYEVQNGGALGTSVDVERDRLFVAGLWGMEVFDLASGRLVARKRLGFVNRPPVIDTVRDRLYVSSTLDGTIRVLDRDSLEWIGELPIGLGVRHAYLSLDGTRLFASSLLAHYAWDPDRLAPGPRASER